MKPKQYLRNCHKKWLIAFQKVSQLKKIVCTALILCYDLNHGKIVHENCHLQFATFHRLFWSALLPPAVQFFCIKNKETGCNLSRNRVWKLNAKKHRRACHVMWWTDVIVIGFWVRYRAEKFQFNSLLQ